MKVLPVIQRGYKPHFTSTIEIVDGEQEFRLIELGKYKRINHNNHQNLTPKDGKIYCAPLTDNVAHAMVDTNSKSGLILESTPNPEARKIKTPIPNEHTRAFVVGGSAMPERDAYKDYYEIPIKKMQAENIPTSYFVDQKRPGGFKWTSAFYDVNKDTWCLHVRNGEVFDSQKKRIVGTSVSTIEQLAEHFKYFYLDKGDQLIIKGKTIPHEVVSKFFKLLK